MFDLNIYLSGLVIVLSLTSVAWLVSLFKRDVSIVDSLWSLMFLALCLTYYLSYDFTTQRSVVVLLLVGVWAIRLSAYITWRNWGEAEDARYQAMRKQHEPNFEIRSLVTVFLLQGVLAWIISAPLLAATTGSVPLNLLDMLGIALVLFGVLYESVADAQLAAFKANRNNRGKVLDTGLWRYTRHPNYFGDFMVWWGLYLIALATGGAWWTIAGPIVMTILLMRVSGAGLLERSLKKRREGYEEYIATTSGFFPRPPKRLAR